MRSILVRKLGFPSGSDRWAIETSIRKRFPSGEGAAEDAVEYIYRIMDRQINKAIGLLAFNALLFAALTLVDARKAFDGVSWWSKAPVTGATLALLSCLPILVILWLKWGSPRDLGSADAELQAAMKVIWLRTYCLSTSLYLSSAATLTAAATLLKILWSRGVD